MLQNKCHFVNPNCLNILIVLIDSQSLQLQDILKTLTTYTIKTA